MREKPVSCPICGAEVRRVECKGKSYYKCSNGACHFRAGLDYTDEELALQGRKLNSVCFQCGEPLEVACGPHGLYPKCFSCDCDSKPMTIGGIVVPRWANAHSWNAKEEIKNLLKEFKEQNEVDYGFEETSMPVATKKAKTIKRAVRKENEDDDRLQGIPQYLRQVAKVFLDNPKEPLSSSAIAEKLNMSPKIARTQVYALKKTYNFLKVVGFKPTENLSGNVALFYQTVDSPFPELRIFSEADGVYTLNSFKKKLRKDHDRCVSISTLYDLVRGKVQVYPIRIARGVSYGYKEEDLLKIVLKIFESPKEEVKLEKETKPMITKKQIETPTDLSDMTVDEIIISKLKRNLKNAFDSKSLGYTTKLNLITVRNRVRALTKRKKLKIVGWDKERHDLQCLKGPIRLQYQLKESPLPKLDVKRDNVNYLTVYQFYNKKIRGLRKTSLQDVVKMVKARKLTPVPLIINYRAYVGYATSDLNKIATELIGGSFKRTYKKRTPDKKVLTKVGTKAKKTTSHKKESTKKSLGFLGTLFSFFNKSHS